MLADLVPETDPTRIGAHATRALVLLAQQMPAEAERELTVAHAACEKTMQPGEPQLATVSVLLGRSQVAQGKKAEGLPLLVGGIDVYSHWGLVHPDDLAAARSALAEARSTRLPARAATSP